MPSIDSDLLFFIALGPAIFAAVILHEAGHVIAARCVGIDIAAWGVGYRRPWFHIRTGGAKFYLGRPLTGGIMIPIRKTIERQPLQEFVMIVGGPLASALGLASGLLALGLGFRSGVLSAWIYVSAIFVLFSLFPYEYVSRNFRLVSDASQLIRILKNGRESQAVPIGPALASTQVLVDLLTEIQCTTGMRYFYSAIASLQAALGDVVSASSSLDSARTYADRCSLHYYAQAIFAAEANPSDAKEVFRSALDECCGDATAEFGIECIRENWQIQRGCGNSEKRRLLRQRAMGESRRDWLCWVEVIDFEAESSEDVETRCRRIQNEFQRHLNGVAAARLLALTSRRLASQGNLERAEVLFHEAEAAIAREAAAIADATTREAYLRSAERPLLEVAEMSGISRPDFEPPALEKRSARPRFFAYASMAVIVPSFITSSIGALLILMGEHRRVERGALALEALAVSGALLSLASIAISIFRGEHRRWNVLSASLTLTILTMAIAGVSMAQLKP